MNIKKDNDENNIREETNKLKNDRINLREEINLIINSENKILQLNKEIKDLNEEKKTVEEIIYYKELDKNIIYQIVLKNNENNLEIYINNHNKKPLSNYFSSFSLESLQKNNYFKLFNNINYFLFEIKDLINNSFINLDTPNSENEFMFLNIPLNLLIIDNIQFKVKKVEKEFSDINKDLMNYIESLEKEKENHINIIKKLNKICFESEDNINNINNDLNKNFENLEAKTNNLEDVKNEKNNIIDDIKKYIDKTNKLIDLKENEFQNFKKQMNEIQNKIDLKLKTENNNNFNLSNNISKNFNNNYNDNKSKNSISKVALNDNNKYENIEYNYYYNQNINISNENKCEKK